MYNNYGTPFKFFYTAGFNYDILFGKQGNTNDVADVVIETIKLISVFAFW